MKQSKQEVIDKILSFNYDALAQWIHSRLHGDDPYFPIYEGYETNLSEFLTESYNHIKNEKFRDNFIEILGDLADELWGYNKTKIEENVEYIYELLSLCGSMKDFENKTTLYRIARSGKLKGFKAFDLELHQLLLTALASYRVAGDYDFWIEQMQDDSNKYYSNAAFYALLNRKYDLDILFNQMGVFVDRFKGEIDLELGIEALLEDYGYDEIAARFEAIINRLSRKQKEAVDDAFMELGYGKMYNRSPAAGKKAVYKPLTPAVSMVGEKPVKYDFGETLKEKAGEIFKRLGFEVHFDYPVAGHVFDIFVKRKKLFSNEFECYLCRCHEGKKKVAKQEVERFLPIRDSAQGCGVIIFSETGFTIDALQLASVHGILLKTLEDLENEKR